MGRVPFGSLGRVLAAHSYRRLEPRGRALLRSEARVAPALVLVDSALREGGEPEGSVQPADLTEELGAGASSATAGGSPP